MYSYRWVEDGFSQQMECKNRCVCFEIYVSSILSYITQNTFSFTCWKSQKSISCQTMNSKSSFLFFFVVVDSKWKRNFCSTAIDVFLSLFFFLLLSLSLSLTLSRHISHISFGTGSFGKFDRIIVCVQVVKCVITWNGDLFHISAKARLRMAMSSQMMRTLVICLSVINISSVCVCVCAAIENKIQR